MLDREKQEAFEDCVMPILLGNTRLAAKIARRIYASTEISSFIYGKMRILDILDISSQPIKLPRTDNARLLCEALIDFCDKYPDMLPLLVPCSSAYEDFVREYSDILESRMVIISPKLLLAPSPLNAVRRAIG